MENKTFETAAFVCEVKIRASTGSFTKIHQWIGQLREICSNDCEFEIHFSGELFGNKLAKLAAEQANAVISGDELFQKILPKSPDEKTTL